MCRPQESPWDALEDETKKLKMSPRPKYMPYSFPNIFILITQKTMNNEAQNFEKLKKAWAEKNCLIQ
jgi:hypothetical protein